MVIDRDLFRKVLSECMTDAKKHYESGSTDMLIPTLVVLMAEEGTEWKRDICLMPVFNENRYELMAELGAMYGKDKRPVVGAVLVTEAWTSVIARDAYEEHPENRVAPRDDPNRKETVLASGLLIDLYSEMMRTPIERDEQGRARLGEVESMTDVDNRIVGTFIQAFAREFISALRAS